MALPARDSSSQKRVPIANFADAGKVVDEVTVHLSFGIIDRFSEGLYSSPNKAFEELVTNSYDAGAGQVWVYLPDDLRSDDASIAVIDDGESMSSDDLHSLWRIGESRKRGANAPKGRASPVGKFGIGKLATYVLATSLTYIVHRDEKYFAVTMDFSVLDPTNTEMLDGIELLLEVVELTCEQAFEAAATALAPIQDDPEALMVLQEGQYPHWTVAVLGKLKSAAQEIKLGRLHWILRTALPLSPQFSLSFNDEILKSSKSDKESLWGFTCGEDESELNLKNGPLAGGLKSTKIVAPDGANVPAVLLPNAGPVAGIATLYKDSIKGGKSDDVGRSHGFFIRVRGRLINVDVDEGGFGLDVELRHGTLSRFFMDVEAPNRISI